MHVRQLKILAQESLILCSNLLSDTKDRLPIALRNHYKASLKKMENSFKETKGLLDLEFD